MFNQYRVARNKKMKETTAQNQLSLPILLHCITEIFNTVFAVLKSRDQKCRFFNACVGLDKFYCNKGRQSSKHFNEIWKL